MTHFLRLFLSMEFKYDHENCSKFSEKAKQRKIYVNPSKCCCGKLTKVFDLQPKTNTPGSDKVCLWKVTLYLAFRQLKGGSYNFFPSNAFLRRRRKKALLRVNDRGGGWRMCILGLCRVYVRALRSCARRAPLSNFIMYTNTIIAEFSVTRLNCLRPTNVVHIMQCLHDCLNYLF